MCDSRTARSIARHKRRCKQLTNRGFGCMIKLYDKSLLFVEAIMAGCDESVNRIHSCDDLSHAQVAELQAAYRQASAAKGCMGGPSPE